MSGGVGCRCAIKNRAQWRVRHYKCNYSAFNGYRKTSSDYSALYCMKCNAHWRTKARYVDSIAGLATQEIL